VAEGAWDEQAARRGAGSGARLPLTYEHFPLAAGLRHLVGAAHLVHADTAQDEDDEAGAASVLAGGLVLVPVAVAGTRERKRRGMKGREEDAQRQTAR